MTSSPGTPALAHLSDPQLGERLRSGDLDVLDHLVATYMTALRDFAYLLVRDADLAYDVAQDVLVYVWEHRETLPIMTSWKGYLFRMTRNRALNVLRSERAQHRRGEALYENYPVAGEPTDSEMLQEETLQRMHAAVSALSPRVREMFVLSKMHGMSHAQIGEVLGVSAVTVKSQISRGLKLLAEQLGLVR